MMNRIPLMLLCSLMVNICTYSTNISQAAEEFTPLRTTSTLTVPVIATPQIDGRIDRRIDASEYAHAQTLSHFSGRRGPTSAQTEAFIGRDAEMLYFAARCYEENLDQLVVGQGLLWQNDCIELFIAVNKDPLFFSHILSTVDEKTNGHAWLTDEWEQPTAGAAYSINVKTQREKDAWTIEFAIPLKEFGFAITDDSVWSLGFCRERKAGGVENSSFAGWFNQAHTWPDMIFQTRALVVDGVGVKNISTQDQRARIAFSCATAVDETPQTSTFTIDIPAGQTTPIDWEDAMNTLNVTPVEHALFSYTITNTASKKQLHESYSLRAAPQAPIEIDLSVIPPADFVTSPLDDDNFWPTSVWMQPASTAKMYKDIGINLFIGGHDSYPNPQDMDWVNEVWEQGIYIFAPIKAHKKWGRYLNAGSPALSEKQFTSWSTFIQRLSNPSDIDKLLLKIAGKSAEKELATARSRIKKNKIPAMRIGKRLFSEYLNTLINKEKLETMPLFADAYASVQAQYTDFATLSPAWLNRRILESAYPDSLQVRTMFMNQHPSFIGWHIGDEPDLVNARTGAVTHTTDEIRAEYIRLRTLDPHHPIFLNLSCGVAQERFTGKAASIAQYKAYVQSSDIICYDVYPVNSVAPNGENRINLQAKGVKNLYEWTNGEKGVWTWLEVNHFSRNGVGREPTHAEIMTQHWMAIIHGATGHGYFCHTWNKKFMADRLGIKGRKLHPSGIAPDVLALLKTINFEIQSLATVLNSPTIIRGTATMKKGRRVDYMIKEQDGVTYLFAVNMFREDASVEITIPGITDSTAVALFQDGVTTPVVDGVLTHTLAPYEVIRYTISPAPAP